MDIAKPPSKPLIKNLRSIFKAPSKTAKIMHLPFLAACTIKLIPPEIFAACRAQADGLWNEGKPKHWYYGIPIVLAWGLALALLLKALL